MAPFGGPVLPLVNKIAAGSSADNGIATMLGSSLRSSASCPAWRRSSSVLVTALAGPRATRSHADGLTHSLASPAENPLCPECLRNADEDFGRGLATALPQITQADPRVDQHRDHARLEQGEYQGKEVEPGADHHHGAGTVVDSKRPQATGDSIAVLVKLSIGQMRITNAAGTVSPIRNHNGQPIRFAARHRGQVGGDVH